MADQTYSAQELVELNRQYTLFSWAVQSAEQVNLLEEPLRPLPVKDGQVELELQPFEMVTIRLPP